MFAVISDIHSNCEALEAVLTDIRRRGISDVVCLGDVVGYGPEPDKCLDTIAQSCRVIIMGNHDFATLYEPAHFNFGAESAVYWTRLKLSAEPDLAAKSRRWEFLGLRPVRHVVPQEKARLYNCRQVLFAHGSPRRPINEYIFPDDLYNNESKLRGAFERFEHLCFVGHTHIPGVFTEDMDFYAPGDLGGTYEVTSGKAIINVGSVGQPRDRDPRASYVIIEPGKITFLRVEYDWDATMKKVQAIANLDDYLGTRLGQGR